jgi:hypothetical protein
MIFVMAALVLAGCGPTPEEKVMRQISLQLRDPNSAQFDQLQQCDGDKRIWRGRVNSKNAFGGYVGFQHFFFDGSRVAYFDTDDVRDLIERCYGRTAEAIP